MTKRSSTCPSLGILLCEFGRILLMSPGSLTAFDILQNCSRRTQQAHDGAIA